MPSSWRNSSAGLVAFGLQQLVHPGAEAAQLIRRQDTAERQEPVVVELVLLVLCERVRTHPETFQHVLHGAVSLYSVTERSLDAAAKNDAAASMTISAQSCTSCRPTRERPPTWQSRQSTRDDRGAEATMRADVSP